jgi:hypothetical protein
MPQVPKSPTFVPMDSISRVEFADFLKRLATSVVTGKEWEKYIVRHYHDPLLERVRADTVRLAIGRCGGKEWSDSEFASLQHWSRELRTREGT